MIIVNDKFINEQLSIIKYCRYKNSVIHFSKPSRVKNIYKTARSIKYKSIRSGHVLLSKQDVKLFLNDAVEVKLDRIKRSTDSILIPCRRGDWQKIIPSVLDNKYKKIYIYIDDKDDETKTTIRTCVVADSINTIFLPNYKCGYSSIKKYVSTIEKNPDIKQKQIDLNNSKYSNYNKLSFVRDPLIRFLSFYEDKINNHINYKHFAKPIHYLMGGVSINNVLDFIDSIPDEFRDPHVKSQKLNMYLDDCLLIHRFYKLENGWKHMFEDNTLPGIFPHTNKSERLITTMEHNQSAGFTKKISSIYSKDYLYFDYKIPNLV